MSSPGVRRSEDPCLPDESEESPRSMTGPQNKPGQRKPRGRRQPDSTRPRRVLLGRPLEVASARTRRRDSHTYNPPWPAGGPSVLRHEVTGLVPTLSAANSSPTSCHRKPASGSPAHLSTEDTCLPFTEIIPKPVCCNCPFGTTKSRLTEPRDPFRARHSEPERVEVSTECSQQHPKERESRGGREPVPGLSPEARDCRGRSSVRQRQTRFTDPSASTTCGGQMPWPHVRCTPQA